MPDFFHSLTAPDHFIKPLAPDSVRLFLLSLRQLNRAYCAKEPVAADSRHIRIDLHI